MPKLTVQHDSALPPQEAFSKIKTFFNGDDDIRRLDPKLQCTFQDSDMTGKATGSQFKADIAIKPSSQGSTVQVIVDLPFLLSPFKGKIEDTIKRKLTKHLA